MSAEFNALFPMPTGGRNADDMGMPPPRETPPQGHSMQPTPRNFEGPFKATPKEQLMGELMDPSFYKNEREHCAAREITELRRELAAANAALAEKDAKLAEMTARAVSLVWHLPPETLNTDVQKWRDEALVHARQHETALATATAQLEAAEKEVEQSHREFEAMQIVARDAMKERDATTAELGRFREMAALAHAGHALYHDDGKLQDTREHPWIDWREDSATTIQAKLAERLIKNHREELVEAGIIRAAAQPVATQAQREQYRVDVARKAVASGSDNSEHYQQLIAHVDANARRHPRYGPCDGLGDNGSCSECDRLSSLNPATPAQGEGKL